jgi:glycosyltransferase 2 family protein
MMRAMLGLPCRTGFPTCRVPFVATLSRAAISQLSRRFRGILTQRLANGDAGRHNEEIPPWSSPLTWMTPTHRKWLWAAVKLLIVVLVLWFIRGAIEGALAELRAYPRSLSPFWPLWLLASAVLYLLGLLPEGLFWHRVLRALGQDARLGETLRAYFIGHLGKYVPGKAMVVVLRTGLIRGQRVDTAMAAASVFLATLTMMSVGAFLAAAVLVVWFGQHRLLSWIALGLMLAAGVPTLPPVFSRLARLAGVGRSDPSVAEKLAGLRYRTLLGGWIGMTVGWLLMGLSLWAVLRAMGLDADLARQLHLYTATVALAVVGGFASFIPGGAVVREAVLTELLGRQLDDASLALISAVLLRLVWLVAELAISGVLFLGVKSASPSGTRPESAKSPSPSGRGPG